MCLKPYRIVLILTILSFIGYQSKAQVTTRPFENLPYSRYAIGEELNINNPAIKAMGGVFTASSNEYYINTENPASYADLRFTTYEAGIMGRRRSVAINNKNFQTGTANISYFNLGIPLGKSAGAVLGFKPLTKVSYSLYDTLNTLIGPSSLAYNGKGGTNYFFIGLGGKYKNLRAGLNFGYIFGTIDENAWYKTTATTNFVNNSEFTKLRSIGGLYSTLGALYDIPLKKDNKIVLGTSLNLKQNVNVNISEYWISHPFYAADTTSADTSYALKNVKSKLTLPTKFSIGAQFLHSDIWTLGIDYSYANWAQYNFRNIPDSISTSTYKLSIGGSYTPNSLNIYNYWKRVTYRAGFNIGKDFVQINNQQANVYSFSAGLSLPFKRGTDKIHTSLEIGKIGQKSTVTIQQNFVKFSLGISFNDRTWFIKRKYD